MSTQENAPQPKREPVKLTVSQVQKDLENGLDRKKIKEKYELTNADLRALFQHPKLKGLKVKDPNKPLGFVLEDDVPEKKAKAPKAASEAVQAEVAGLDADRDRIVESTVAPAAAPEAAQAPEAPAPTPAEPQPAPQAQPAAASAPRTEPVKEIQKGEW